MPAVSVRLKTATAAKSVGSRAHNERLGGVPDYVDASRSADNSIIISSPTPSALSAECLRRRQAAFEPGLTANDTPRRAPRRTAKNAAVAVDGIVTFSTDAQPTIDALTPEQQNERFQRAVQAVADHLGTDVAGLAVHRDESAIHCHFVLHGVGLDGQPVSRKMNKLALSQAQDAAATAFDDLGITRGKRIGERIANGEPRSKTINRSVQQLHHDLPRELEQAQARVADMERLTGATAEKLTLERASLANAKQGTAQATGKLKALEKRLATYEKRLADRQAEADRLADLAHIPEPKKRVIETPQPRKMGLFKQAPERESLIFYTPQQMRGYAGKAKAQVNKSDQERRKLARNVRERTKDYQHATQQPRERHTSGLEAVGGVLVRRYGLMVTETASRVSVPPQKPASPAQITAALYRSSREKNWPTIHFSVSDQVAEKLTQMAVADGIADTVTFDDMGQRIRLLEAQKAHKRQTLAESQAPAPGKPTNQPLDLDDDLDDGPSGPGAG